MKLQLPYAGMVRWACLSCGKTGAVPTSAATLIYDRIITDHNHAITDDCDTGVIQTDLLLLYPAG